jgi:hypothetical protein
VDDADYAMAVVAHRCPEVAGLVLPVAVLEFVLQIVDHLQDRVDGVEAILSARAGRAPEGLDGDTLSAWRWTA